MKEELSAGMNPTPHTKFQDSFAEEVWRSTYKYHEDETIDDTLKRVARAIASVEETDELKEKWTNKFYDMLSEFKVVPGGRILANAGTEFKGTTLINCYVGPKVEKDVDSIDGIMKAVKDQCKTLKSEGGYGMDFSMLRPRGSFIHGIGVDSPGSVKFMEIWDKTSEIITAGSGKKSSNKKAKGKIRKGAMMGSLAVWHPDIEEFIRAKQTPGRLTKFNVSVSATDEFMRKLLRIREIDELIRKCDIKSEKRIADLKLEREENDKWYLRFPVTTFEQYKEKWDGDLKEWEEKGYPVQVYKTISVTGLWNMIMESNFARAEPGVLFISRANQLNPLYYGEKVVTSNPCVSGDTIVAVADGRQNVTIKELANKGKDVDVYCLDENDKIKIRKMRNPRKTGIGEAVYEVLLDDGSIIKCTGNHKFRLKNGEYKEALQLEEKDSLRLMTKYYASFGEVFNRPEKRQQRTILNLTEQGYNTKIINGQVNVEKECENCHDNFWIDFNRREIAHCSVKCSSETNKRRYNDDEIRKKHSDKMSKLFSERKEKDRELQAQAYNDLKFDLDREPMKKEWEEECKIRGLRFRMGEQSPFRYYKDLKEYASMQNHKVVSVNFIGHEDVYNGTVDEFHNFFVGGFESETKSKRKKFSYINNLNCGEQLLSNGNVCCLGTLNLTQFVSPNALDFDLDKIKKYVHYLVRFLDNVNTYSNAPLPEYKESMMKKRRIGIGVMGWGSSLYMLKIPFSSSKSELIQSELMKIISNEAYKASIDLAEEKGMFEYCDPEKHAKGLFVQNLDLPEHYMNMLKNSGIRNSSLLSCQPNGNGGILANIVSGGIEPVFMPEYTRTVIVNEMPDEIAKITPKWYEGEWHETKLFKFEKEGDEEILKGKYKGTTYKIDKNRGLTKEVICQDYGVRWLEERGQWEPDADWATTTEKLTVQQHLSDLKGFARWLDSSASKTVNVPYEYPFEDFKNIYLDAYSSGYIKGITTYRAGTMTSVLSAKEEKDAAPEDEEIILEDVEVPTKAPAVVSTIRAEGKKWYLTTIMDESQKRPIAFFVHTNHHEKSPQTLDAVDRLLNLAEKKGIPSKWIEDTANKMGGDSNSTKIARCISLNLRHGVLIRNVVGVLNDIEDVFVGSFLFQIRKHLMSWIKDGEPVTNGNGGATCIECGGAMRYESGCSVCSECGNSKCG